MSQQITLLPKSVKTTDLGSRRSSLFMLIESLEFWCKEVDNSGNHSPTLLGHDSLTPSLSTDSLHGKRKVGTGNLTESNF